MAKPCSGAVSRGPSSYLAPVRGSHRCYVRYALVLEEYRSVLGNGGGEEAQHSRAAPSGYQCGNSLALG